MVLKEMKINHAQVLFRGDYGADELIDVVLGNRVYTRALYCYNKCDLVSAILAVTAATPFCSIPPHWLHFRVLTIRPTPLGGFSTFVPAFRDLTGVYRGD